jgi:hypothetical protein
MTTSNTTTPAPAPAEAPYQPQFEDDTISLIDLVAVVVRHRRLILVGTILTGVIAAAVLFFGPMAGLEMGPSVQYTAERRIILNPLPREVQEFVTVDIPSTVRSILENPQLVGRVFAEFEEDPPPDRSQERYLTMIRRDIIGDRYTVAWDNNTRSVTLRYTNSTVEHSRAFLEAIVAELGPEVTATMTPLFEEAAEALDTAYERSLEEVAMLVSDSISELEGTPDATDPATIIAGVDRSGGTALRTLADLTRAVGRLEVLAEDTDALWSTVGNIAVFEDTTGTGRSTIVVITTITAFFLTVFLAFVLEYIRRVRQEPEEMEKLESAWRRL